MTGPRRRLTAYALGLVAPWVVVISPGGTTVLTGLVLVDPVGLHVTTAYSYVFAYTRGLPAYLLAWPIGTGVYLLGFANAVVGTALGREDRRVTLAAVGIAALTQVTVALGFLRRPGYLAVPVALVVLPVLAALADWSTLRSLVRR